MEVLHGGYMGFSSLRFGIAGDAQRIAQWVKIKREDEGHRL
jgi:hypothetical protein